METLIIETHGKKMEALKAVLRALDISFKPAETTYDADFIAKMKRGDDDIKNGRTHKIKVEELWK